MASIASPNKSQSSSSIASTTFKKSSSRVFIDVSPPRHQGPRLSLADVDPDASKARKTSSTVSAKPTVKEGEGKLNNTSNRSNNNNTTSNRAPNIMPNRAPNTMLNRAQNNTSSRALKPTTRTNSFTGVKRGREEEKEEKEGAKKRKVEVDGTIQKSNKKETKPRGGGTVAPKKKLDTTTVAPVTVADSESLVKKVVVKKPLQEPQPLWTRVGADFTREEIEERILLREFTLRFNECLGLKRPVLEKLEDFGDFDDVTAKALLLAIMEVIRQDSPSDERRVIADFIKQVRARGMTFYDILYSMHHRLRTGTGLHIPDLSTVLKRKEHDVDSNALIPVMLALIDDVLETDGARKEVDRWKEEAAEVRRTYHRGMKEEKEHWAPLRVKFMDEKKVGGVGFDLAKWKKKFEAAKARHDAVEHALKFTLIKQLAEIAPRFTPLVDMDGRTYYIHTPSLRKPPAKSTRDDFGKWTWFVAVWGARPASAKRLDEGEEDVDNGESSSLTEEEESEDEISGAKEDRHAREAKRAGREGWWGFGEAAELRLLAKWLQWRDREAGSVSVEGSTHGDEDGSPEAEDDDKQNDASKRLVTALLDFASVLQYADDVIAK